MIFFYATYYLARTQDGKLDVVALKWLNEVNVAVLTMIGRFIN